MWVARNVAMAGVEPAAVAGGRAAVGSLSDQLLCRERADRSACWRPMTHGHVHGARRLGRAGSLWQMPSTLWCLPIVELLPALPCAGTLLTGEWGSPARATRPSSLLWSWCQGPSECPARLPRTRVRPGHLCNLGQARNQSPLRSGLPIAPPGETGPRPQLTRSRGC